MKTSDLTFFASEEEIMGIVNKFLAEKKNIIVFSDNDNMKLDLSLNVLMSRTIWIKHKNDLDPSGENSFVNCPMIIFPKTADKELLMGVLAIKYTNNDSLGYKIYLELKKAFLGIFNNGVTAQNIITGASRFYNNIYYSEKGRDMAKNGYYLRSRYGDGNINYVIDFVE